MPPLRIEAGERFVPVLLGERVVHEDVDPTELGRGCVGQPPALVGVGDVRCHRDRPPPARLDLLGNRLEVADGAGADGDVGAGARQPQRDGAAEAGAHTRDDRDPPVQHRHENVF